MDFNLQQKEAIDARGHVIVSAGAGSGKTTVLVERYISLIEHENLALENILCLTFTRKAASEMYQKIHERLGTAQSSSLKREFLRFERARITTIDSFCSRIIKAHASEFGYPTNFSIDDHEFYRGLEAFVLRYLSTPSRSRVMSRLLEQFSVKTIAEQLFMRLASDFVSLSKSPQDHGSHAFGLLLDLIHKELDSFVATIPALREANETQKGAKNNKEHHLRAIAELDECMSIIEEIAHDSASFQQAQQQAQQQASVLHRLEQLTHALRKTISALSTFARMKIWRPFREYREQIKTILLPSLVIFMDQEFYGRFYALIEDFIERVLEFKRKKGVLYYRDLLEMAIQVLLQHPDYADYYRNEIQHIMIDEFQDNNKLQKELLFLLSVPAGYRKQEIPSFSQLHNNGLFLVGDQKQSIYRFRGADVSVFRSLRKEFQSTGKILSLDRNYRSSPRLIDFFNRFFPRIMGGTMDFEADYHPLTAGIEQDIPSHIELVLVPDSQKDDNEDDNENYISGQEAEAYAIAQRIHEICSEKTLQKKVDGLISPIDYDDIAILFRSGTMQYLIEKMLRRFAIPYSSDNIRSLFLEAPTFDTHAFLKFCLFPEDHYSLAALLRSPFCRMDDDGVALLLNTVSEKRSEKTPAQVAEAGIPSPEKAAALLSPANHKKYAALLALVDEIRGKIGHCSHIEILGDLWRKSGYYDFITSTPQRQAYLEHYDYLLEFFELHAQQPLVELLDSLEENLDSIKKIENIDIVHGGRTGLRLMTIHKSKGLEFPLVFLVNCNGRSHNHSETSSPWVQTKDGSLILYAGLNEEMARKYLSDTVTEPAAEVLELPPLAQADQPRVNPQLLRAFRNPLVKQVENLERQQENAETRRLLYVALTRAQQHLIISASKIRETKETKGQPSTNHSRDDRRENFFDLFEAGLSLDAQKIQGMEALHCAAFDSNAGELSLTIPEPILRSQLESTKAGSETHDLAGPPAPLDLPTIFRRQLSVSDIQLAAHGENAQLAAPAPRTWGAATDKADTPGAADEAADFGTMLHYLLEHVVPHFHTNGDVRIPEAPAALLSPFKNAGARYTEACQLISTFAESAFFQSIREAEEFHCEFPFLMNLSPYLISGKIDLVMRSAGKTILLDYKTGADVIPESYIIQIDTYRLALEMMGWQNIEAGIYDLRRNTFTLLERQYGRDVIEALAEQSGQA